MRGFESLAIDGDVTTKERLDNPSRQLLFAVVQPFVQRLDSPLRRERFLTTY
jgi:hypothetical protein